jgi:hypothetical protein
LTLTSEQKDTLSDCVAVNQLYMSGSDPVDPGPRGRAHLHGKVDSGGQQWNHRDSREKERGSTYAPSLHRVDLFRYTFRFISESPADRQTCQRLVDCAARDARAVVGRTHAADGGCAAVAFDGPARRGNGGMRCGNGGRLSGGRDARMLGWAPSCRGRLTNSMTCRR